MFKNILIPLDGSKLSEAALPIAVYIVSRCAAQVTLVHVIEEHPPESVHGERHLREEKEAEEYLRNISQTFFPEGTKVVYHVHTDKVQNVADSITEHTGDFKSDLIVMCTHGHTGLHHMIAGNIAQKVVVSSRSPMIVIRPGRDYSVEKYECKKILVPLDGNTEHEKILPLITEMARVCKVALHFPLVVPTFTTLSGDMAVTSRSLPGTASKLLDLSEDEAIEYLDRLISELKSKGLEVSYEVLRGDPAAEIAEVIKREKYDLVALATHAKSRADAFWSGSLTPRIIKNCPMPILLVPVEGN